MNMGRTLSREQFEMCAKQFIKVSDELFDGWLLVEGAFKNQSYLAKNDQVLMEKLAISKCTEDTELLDVISDSEESVTSLEDSSVVPDEGVVLPNNDSEKEWINCDYQVVYSESYSVPVIYCRMWTRPGILLTAQQVWKFAPTPARGWSQLTVVPHPITDAPWIQVHPCKTADIMGEVLSKTEHDENYIMTFLSIYGQAVGLHISPDYVSKIHSDQSISL